MFDSNATKIGSRFKVNTNTKESASFPSLANLNNDQFVAVWQGDSNIFGQIFSSTEESSSTASSGASQDSSPASSSSKKSSFTISQKNFFIYLSAGIAGSGIIGAGSVGLLWLIIQKMKNRKKDDYQELP